LSVLVTIVVFRLSLTAYIFNMEIKTYVGVRHLNTLLITQFVQGEEESTVS